MEFLKATGYILMSLAAISFMFAAAWLTIHVVRWDRMERERCGK